MEPCICKPEDAKKIWQWLLTRGGILIWRNVDLSTVGDGTMTTPATNEDGSPKGPPSWKHQHIDRRITDPADVKVVQSTVIEEVPVGVERQNMQLFLTDGAMRKMENKLAKHQQANPGKEIWWTPTGDLMDHTCVIMMDGEQVPIADWIASNNADVTASPAPESPASPATPAV